MSAAKRSTNPSLIDTLNEHPYRFEFFQTIRLLERHFQNLGVCSEIVGELVHFRNSLSLSFPSGEIEKLDHHDASLHQKNAYSNQLHNTFPTLATYEITPSFFGLTGLVGALPSYYTERIIEREVIYRDYAARAFLDMFTNRMLTLFYQAWKKYRLPILHEQNKQNLFIHKILSLVGCDHSSVRQSLDNHHQSLMEDSIAYYAGVTRHRPTSTLNIQNLLADYFKVSLKILQLIGHWCSIPPEQQTILSGKFAELGVSSFCGAKIWQRQTRIRILIGPLTKRDFLAFLPYGKTAKVLSKWLSLTLGACFEYEVYLILKKEEIFQAKLGDTINPARLGWDVFLLSIPPNQDSEDARYELKQLHNEVSVIFGF